MYNRKLKKTNSSGQHNAIWTEQATGFDSVAFDSSNFAIQKKNKTEKRDCTHTCYIRSY